MILIKLQTVLLTVLLTVAVFKPAISAICDDSGCIQQQGNCQEDNLDCLGTYESGHCAGHSTRRCCVPSGDDSACLAEPGFCQYTSTACYGTYVTGLCAGPTARKCCLPSGGDDPCIQKLGHCKDDSKSCSGSYYSGLCAGTSGRRCCVPSGCGGCGDVNIISRSGWGARDPTSTTSINTPVDLFFVHHTVTGECSDQASCSAKVRGIQDYHMDTKGWDDIGYSFLVGGDGNVYEGRGWSNVGAHTKNYNSDSFAASMIGDFSSTLPTAAALTAVKNLMACGVELGKLNADFTMAGHRDSTHSTTACPGNTLYTEIKSWPSYSISNL